jgi:hypothetical protein
MGFRLASCRHGLAFLAVLLLPLAFVRPAATQDDGGDPEATALLEQAAAAMAQVQSFRFRLTTENGVTTIFDQIELESVEGVVQRPDRFMATVTAKVAFVSVGLDVIGIGDTLWIQDPLSQSGEFSEVGLGSGVAELINPDRLFVAAVDLVENPAIVGEVEVDGVKATVVEGDFRPLRALELAGTPIPTPSAEDQAEVGLVLDEPLFTQIWIDEQGRVIQMAFAGRLMVGEDPEIIRVLRLSNFDEPVTIEAPATE